MATIQLIPWLVLGLGCTAEPTTRPHRDAPGDPPAEVPPETTSQGDLDLRLAPDNVHLKLPTVGTAPDPDPSAILFDDDQLPEFDIEVDEVGMAALRADPYRYVQGALIFDGVRYEPVGVRLKGENSFQPVDQKPSLKIDMNRYEDLELHGLKGLTLNNMDSDPSMMHERLAYRVYREFGVPAARCTHSWVTLNGRELGLYAHVETVDKTMIERWYDKHGSMYEIFDVDFRPAFSPYDFELEFGPSAIQAIQDATEALDELDHDLALQQVEPYMNVDEFVDYFAVSAVVGQFDAYPYSNPGDDAHVYLDPTSGQFVFLPHGVDESLSRMFRPPFDMNFGQEGIVGEHCLLSPTCKAQLDARIQDVLDMMDSMDLYGYAEQVMDQIAPMTVADTAKPYTDVMVAEEQANLLRFLSERRGDF